MARLWEMPGRSVKAHNLIINCLCPHFPPTCSSVCLNRKACISWWLDLSSNRTEQLSRNRSLVSQHTAKCKNTNNKRVNFTDATTSMYISDKTPEVWPFSSLLFEQPLNYAVQSIRQTLHNLATQKFLLTDHNWSTKLFKWFNNN